MFRSLLTLKKSCTILTLDVLVTHINLIFPAAKLLASISCDNEFYVLTVHCVKNCVHLFVLHSLFLNLTECPLVLVFMRNRTAQSSFSALCTLPSLLTDFFPSLPSMAEIKAIQKEPDPAECGAPS